MQSGVGAMTGLISEQGLIVENRFSSSSSSSHVGFSLSPRSKPEITPRKAGQRARTPLCLCLPISCFLSRPLSTLFSCCLSLYFFFYLCLTLSPFLSLSLYTLLSLCLCLSLSVSFFPSIFKSFSLSVSILLSSIS